MFTLLTTSTLVAQDANNPWAVTVGINAVDVYSPLENHPNAFPDFAGTGDWNILPSISRITVEKYLNSGFTLQLAGSVNKITSVAIPDDADLIHTSFDANLKYKLLGKRPRVIDPFLYLGGGYTALEGEGEAMLNYGYGVNFWLSETVGLVYQGGTKKDFSDIVPTHFQHSLGIVVKFGGTDTDGDGIYDKFDSCPEVAGLKEFNGCPDTDGDGVLDKDDNCINEVGPASNDGCPEPVITVVAEKEIGEFAKTILFKSGKSTFLPKVSEKLDGIVNIMQEFSKATFMIEGHTDSTGSESLNQKLSAKRAAAVQTYLAENGIDASRFCLLYTSDAADE